MRQFLLGMLTGLLTIAVLLGCARFIAKRKNPPEPVSRTEMLTEPVLQTETAAQTLPEETLPPETTLPETQPAVETVTTVDAVPKYYQTDYPYVDFGNGTIATSGCSITCLAMVATYLTDQEYTPVQMAYHFGDYGQNNIQRLDYGLAQMQIPYTRMANVQDVLEAVRSGKVAIVMVNEESVFTTQQHFIVVAGMTEDGRFIVNDPYKTTYLQADVALKHAYENGFEDFYLLRGFSGGWIFDKQAMPEEPFLFDASLPEQKENRYTGYLLPDEDIYMFASFVWAEARNEPPEVQQAVAEVVLNRMMSDKYPNTIRDIIYGTEFSRAAKTMAKWGEENFDPYMAVDAAMYGPYVLPEDICFYSIWEEGEGYWGQLGSYKFYKER